MMTVPTPWELTRRRCCNWRRPVAQCSWSQPDACGAASDGAAAEPITGFLSADQRAILDAATARLFPSDTTAGAREAGVVDYIDGSSTRLPSADANVMELVGRRMCWRSAMPLAPAPPSVPRQTRIKTVSSMPRISSLPPSVVRVAALVMASALGAHVLAVTHQRRTPS